MLGGASNLLGGLFGDAQNVASTARDITDRGARDEALKKASNEIMPLFQRCPRDQKWVDETCWNEARPLHPGRAEARLGSGSGARRRELTEMRETMQNQAVFSGDVSARATVCSNCAKPVGSEKFCSNCGTPVGMAKCKSCGNDLAAGTRFCGNYGTPPA